MAGNVAAVGGGHSDGAEGAARRLLRQLALHHHRLLHERLLDRHLLLRHGTALVPVAPITPISCVCTRIVCVSV